MTKSTFHGVFPYLVSPIGADGNVLDDALGQLVDHLVKSGVHWFDPHWAAQVNLPI